MILDALKVWKDLPDPRDPAVPDGGKTAIILTRAALRHIAEKHIKDEREPWKDLLTRDHRKVLLQWAGGQLLSEAEKQLFDEALEILRLQVVRSLQRPMVLLYCRRQVSQNAQVVNKNWCLVLPSGAVAIAREIKDGAILVTCYFLKASVVSSSRDRWQKTARQLVKLYGDFRESGIYPPHPSFSRAGQSGGRAYVDTDIRFVTLEQWGFSVNTPGNPWRGRLGTWEDAEAKPEKPRRRLRPR